MNLQERLKKLEQKDNPAEPETWVLFFTCPPHWDDTPAGERNRIEEEVARTIAQGIARKSELICCGVPEGYPGIED
jgi:hypothetical protein